MKKTPKFVSAEEIGRVLATARSDVRPMLQLMIFTGLRKGVPRVHGHALRHTFGSQMAMAGADPFAIKKALGHADIKTTMIYVSLGKSHIRDQVAGRATERHRDSEEQVLPFSRFYAAVT